MSAGPSFRVDSPELLESVCRLSAAGKISEKIFHASVIEAVKLGVDVRPVLLAAGIRPASLVSAGLFDGEAK